MVFVEWMVALVTLIWVVHIDRSLQDLKLLTPLCVCVNVFQLKVVWLLISLGWI